MLRKSLLLLIIALTCFKGNAQIYVNEFSNGPSGTNQEFVELVVSNGIPGSTVDIRGWIIDDNSGYWSCGVGWGIASGHLRFAQINNWRCVPTGSIILLYNDQNKHPLIT